MIFSGENNSRALAPLMDKVLQEGTEVETRNGPAKEILGARITIENSWPPYIIAPSRNAAIPAQIAEMMWILAGRNDVDWLEAYLPRARDFSDDGETWRGGYGPRLRDWNGQVDQLAHVVQLLREDPATRRAVMNIYDPAQDSQPGKDIPCNNWLHFIARDGVLQLFVATRSNDLMWGWSGINSFEWSVLLNIVAGLTGLQAGPITYNISSLHLYERHYKKARRIVDTSPHPDLPGPSDGRLQFTTDHSIAHLDGLVARWFRGEKAIREEAAAGGPLANEAVTKAVNGHINWMRINEPVFADWLVALRAYWNRDREMMSYELSGWLSSAMVGSPLRKLDNEPDRAARDEDARALQFANEVAELHSAKHEAYGDSWMRRGEQMAIMANIARKVDRLGANGGGDTATDTAVDLYVYLVKYRLWIAEREPEKGVLWQGRDYAIHLDRTGASSLTTDSVAANYVILQMAAPSYPRHERKLNTSDIRNLEARIRGQFDELEKQVKAGPGEPLYDLRYSRVEDLIDMAYSVAFQLWKTDKWKEANATRAWKGYDA